MNADRLFNNIREETRRIVPSELNISAIEFEGPIVVIYTKDFDKFSENTNIIKMLAAGLKKRVEIRPDPSTLQDSDEVEKKLREKIPAEAEVTDFHFDYEDMRINRN